MGPLRAVAFRSVFRFAACLAGLATVHARADAGPLDRTRDRTMEGAVVVTASGSTRDGIGAGTIVAIDGNRVAVLTAKHVATFGSLTIHFPSGAQAAAHIATLIDDRDLALVEADTDAATVASLHAASIGTPAPYEPVHVWGSGHDGPAFETAATQNVGAPLPDGDVRARFAVTCRLCHEGDSGAGIFDAGGALIGVYVGYFVMDDGRVGVAERMLDHDALVASGIRPATLARTRASGNVLAGGEFAAASSPN